MSSSSTTGMQIQKGGILDVKWSFLLFCMAQALYSQHCIAQSRQHNTTVYNPTCAQSTLTLFSPSGLPRKDRSTRTRRGGWTTGILHSTPLQFDSTSSLILCLLLENYETLRLKYVLVTTAESWKTIPVCTECNQDASNGFEKNFGCLQWDLLSFKSNDAWAENKLFHLIKTSICCGRIAKVVLICWLVSNVRYILNILNTTTVSISYLH